MANKVTIQQVSSGFKNHSDCLKSQHSSKISEYSIIKPSPSMVYQAKTKASNKQKYSQVHQSHQIFTGNNYKTRINQINITQNATVKYFNSKIYIYQNNNIQQNDKINTNTYQFYPPPSTLFYSQSITTNKFIILHLKNICPSLAVIDKTTMKMSTTFPNGQDNCQCIKCDQLPGVLQNLKNGKIAYGIRSNLYILNAETLKIQQKIIQNQQFYTDFTSIDSFYNQVTQESTILIKGSFQRYKIFSYNKQTKNYEESEKIYGASQNMKLTDINQAYSFISVSEGNQLLHWNKLKNIILYQNKTVSDQCLQKKMFVDMPKSENFFVMRSDYTFYFYELNDSSPSYDIKLKKSVYFDEYFKQTKLTSDEKLLILFTKQFYLFFYDLDSEKITQLESKEYQDFLVFNSKYDRFIVLRSVNQPDPEGNEIIGYTIEIRKISDPQTLIKEVPLILPQQTQIFGVKLIHNDAWDLDFVVLFKIEDDSSGKYKYKDRTIQKFCTFQNDEIIQKQLKTKEVSFINTFASQKWIATILLQSALFHILDRKTLQQGGNYDLGFYDYNNKEVYPYFYNNALIIQHKDNDQLLFLDLNKNTFDQMEISRLPLYKNGRYPLIQKLIYFPSRNILYRHSFYTISNYQACKTIFNTDFPIDKVTIYSNLSYINQQIYISKSKNDNNINEIQKDNLLQKKANDCDMVISKDLTNKLSVFKNCQPFNQTKQYETQHVFNRNSTQLYECSDHKHIVLKYSTIPGYKLQIRSLEDDLKIVWETQPKSNNPSIPMIDLTQDNILIYNQIDSLTVTKFGSIQSATGKYNFISIYDFVYNKKGDSAITGYVKTIYQDSSSQHIIGFIVVSNINNKKTTIFQHEVTIFNYSYLLSQSKIRLNQNSTKILLSYTETYAQQDRQIKIQVWDVQGNQLAFQLQRSGLGMELIQFLNQTHFIIKIDNKTEIISYQTIQQASSSFNQGILSSNQVISLPNKFAQSLPESQKIIISNDGSIMALLTDSVKGNIIIFDINQTEIGKIELENASIISDILFDKYNKLYVIDNSTKIFIFSKSTCGKTFVDVNSYCQCRANLTLVDSVCQCQQNFQKFDDNSCICTGSDKCFYQNQCIICSFMCSECQGPGFSCISFSVWFYVIFIGGPLIIICTVIAMILIKNKNKNKKGQKNVKISEATSKDLLIDESLESQLRD